MPEFKVKNTAILLKYLNCLERVFFIDNRWMKDYEDIKNNVKREYLGVPKYLKYLIDYFDKNELSVLNKSLPDKEDLKTIYKEIKFIVLDSVSSSLFISDEEKHKNYIVIACPDIEKVFHFKAESINEKDFLKKGVIRNFDFHPSLPRIKIYSKDINLNEEKSGLEELKFMYTLPKDAQLQISSLKVHNGNVLWDELVADPSYGLQIGNLGLYFIAPIKIKEIKANQENLHQIILIAEDWEKNTFEFNITSQIYKAIFKEFPKIGLLEKSAYIRCLTFQGYGENFRHILHGEIIDEPKFIKDSFLAFLRFRKVIDKSLLSNYSGEQIDNIREYKNKLYYLPNGFEPDIFDSQEQFKTKNWAESIIKLRRYNEFESICMFHNDWKELYSGKLNVLEEYNLLRLSETPTYGIHRDFLKDPLYKFTFYARNKDLEIFCLNCKEYLEHKKTRDIPIECPICHSKVLVALDKDSDLELLKEEKSSKSKELAKYNQKATLFISFSKYLYYTLNFTNYSLNTCVEILNELKGILSEENRFFDKLFKIKELYDRRQDIHNVLYRIDKNEV